MYHEIKEIAEEFEDSLKRVLVPMHASDNYDRDDGQEATLWNQLKQEILPM